MYLRIYIYIYIYVIIYVSENIYIYLSTYLSIYLSIYAVFSNPRCSAGSCAGSSEFAAAEGERVSLFEYAVPADIKNVRGHAREYFLSVTTLETPSATLGDKRNVRHG